MSVPRRLARLAGRALLALPLLLLGGCVESMFYYPDRVRYETPDALGLRYERVRFQSTDGTALSGWFIPAAGRADPREAKGTVIHFHGNAQNMSSHWRFVAWLPKQDFNVFVFDYRGYGDSEGKPEPRGVFEDSGSAIDHVRSRADVDPARFERRAHSQFVRCGDVKGHGLGADLDVFAPEISGELCGRDAERAGLSASDGEPDALVVVELDELHLGASHRRRR